MRDHRVGWTFALLTVVGIGAWAWSMKSAAASSEVAENDQGAGTLRLTLEKADADAGDAPTWAALKVSVENKGTAAVSRLRVAVWVPAGATLEDNGGGKYNAYSRMVLWKAETLRPGETKAFQVKLDLAKAKVPSVDAATEGQDAEGQREREDKRIDLGAKAERQRP